MKCPYCGRENTGSICTKCHAEIRGFPPVKKPEKADKTNKKEDKERS